MPVFLSALWNSLPTLGGMPMLPLPFEANIMATACFLDVDGTSVSYDMNRLDASTDKAPAPGRVPEAFMFSRHILVATR